MKRIKGIWPFVLAVIIAFAGYWSVDGIKALMPSHKDTVRIFDKPSEDSLFYMGKYDELTVYPWDVFDEGACEPLISDSKFRYGKYHDIIFSNQIFFPGEAKAFEPQILYDEKLDIFFVNEYIYTSVKGAECSVSYAFTYDAVLHLHFREVNRQDLTPDEIQRANEKINQYLAEFHKANLYHEIVTGSEGNVAIAPPIYGDTAFSNPLFSFYSANNVPPLVDTPVILNQQDELLMFYQVKGAQIVLYYNPQLDAISGFSIKQ
jgi:hypothetical protein